MKRTEAEVLESMRTISRRGLLVGGGIAAFIAMLGGRMRYLQVEQAEE